MPLFELFRAVAENLLFFALHLSGSSFPQPMSAQRERESFEALSKGKDEAKKARDALIRHNLRLVAHIVKKYYSPTSEPDDLISTGTIGLIKAVDTFKLGRSARFSTYASRCIENEILMQFRQEKKLQCLQSFSDAIDGDDSALTLLDVICDDSDLADSAELSLDLKRLSEALPKTLFGRDRMVIELRYGLDGARPHTQQQTAKMLGISRSYVSRIESRSLEKLRRVLESAR